MASALTAEHAATWAKRLLAAAGLAYTAHQIFQLGQSTHTHASGTAGSSSSAAAAAAAASTVPACGDASLFPQLFPSASVPGLSLYRRRWLVARPRLVVFVVHGFGEHSGRYEVLAAQLNALGASVYALDHQGHGQSGGDRAYVQSFDHYTLDVLSFVERTQNELSAEGSEQLPCFLYGHSMGGVSCTQNQALHAGTASAGSSLISLACFLFLSPCS